MINLTSTCSLTINGTKAALNQKYEFYDDCRVWISKKGNTCKSSYYLEGDRLVYCEL